MKNYESKQIRNIAIVGHQGAGKTSLTECMIYNTGAVNRLGKVLEGNTVADYFPEEIKRKITINTSLVACEVDDHKINLLDTPGFTDFLGEVESSLAVADTVLMAMDAVAGPEVSTEIIWDIADDMKLPIIAFANKLDRENADLYKAYDLMHEKLSREIVLVQLPIGAESGFNGIVDIIEEKACTYENGKATLIDIPADMLDLVAEHREKLIEVAAECDDELIEKYLEGEELTKEEIIRGLTIGIKDATIVPVLIGSSIKNIGADALANFIINYAPDPLTRMDSFPEAKPVSAMVFKTLADPFVGKINMFKVYTGKVKGDSTYYNTNKDVEEKFGQIFTMQGKTQTAVTSLNPGDIGVVAKLVNAGTEDVLTKKGNIAKAPAIKFSWPTYTVAIAPKSKGDEDKLGNGIARLLEEDRTIKYEKNIETKQNLLTAMGEAHVDIIIEMLSRKFGVAVEVIEMRHPYRETIRTKATRIEGKHKKQSGGHGQFGHVYIDLEPEYDNDFIFEEKIFGGSVPKQYIPAVEKGIAECMERGILAGYPVTHIKATLLDGSYHPVDSSEMAFKIAVADAFKRACEKAKPCLLEPIMYVKVTIPDQYMGDIMGDLNSRRGRILGMEQEGKFQIIRAHVPLSEMTRYTIDLKSITQGRGRFKMKFVNYEEAPQNIADKIIAAANA